MELYELSNNEIMIRVSSFGAELKSLKDRKTGKEYLWDANPDYWKRTSPVLCPIQEGEKQSDYKIHFENTDKITAGILNDHGTLSKEEKTYPLENGYLDIGAHLFDEDALIVEHHQAQKVSLCDPAGKAYLTVSFTAPLFGIWSPAKKNAPFVCIEPWYGRCDKEGFAGELPEREYGNCLAGREQFEQQYTISI